MWGSQDLCLEGFALKLRPGEVKCWMLHRGQGAAESTEPGLCLPGSQASLFLAFLPCGCAYPQTVERFCLLTSAGLGLGKLERRSSVPSLFLGKGTRSAVLIQGPTSVDSTKPRPQNKPVKSMSVLHVCRLCCLVIIPK